MKYINWQGLIILSFEEFIEILDNMPDEYLVKLAKRYGIAGISLPYTKKKLVDKIMTEAEEQP